MQWNHQVYTENHTCIIILHSSFYKLSTQTSIRTKVWGSQLIWPENFTVCEKLYAELLVARLEIDEGGNLHMYWLCQMAVRPPVIRRWGCRLTGVCLMAVRNRVPGFMGGRWHKRREWRIGLQTWSPQTHWQMSGFVPLKGARKRKVLWIKGPLLSFWCGALSPADHSQRKGQVMTWLHEFFMSLLKINMRRCLFRWW